MRYVVLVHKDEGRAYGVIVPDVRGCFSAGDTLEEAMRNTAEAIEFHLDGASLPPARSTDDILGDPELEEDLEGAMIAIVEVKEANVPIDKTLSQSLDRAATERGISRAAFVERALREAVERA